MNARHEPGATAPAFDASSLSAALGQVFALPAEDDATFARRLAGFAQALTNATSASVFADAGAPVAQAGAAPDVAADRRALAAADTAGHTILAGD
ncbi:MAG: hypothetical protein AAFW46_19255, partial [Pseudomonadota bacterium]